MCTLRSPNTGRSSQHGKAGIEVRHLLSHTSGVSGWEPPFAPDDIYDWDRSTSLLAAQAPWWEPGSANARSVARIQSIVSNGGEVDGVRLLSPRTIELIFDQQSDGVDLAWAAGEVRDRLWPAAP
jgi:Beta-lactamase